MNGRLVHFGMNGIHYRQNYNQVECSYEGCVEDNTRMYKVFNDSVHGHIALHPLCVSIIDTPQFQRLRNIKQLSVANYVYPGACHSRFEHSLGVCHLAGRMVEALRRNEKFWSREPPIEITEKEKLLVEIAGLCHDLGHGPFSHTWEKVVSAWDHTWHHETTSGEMLKYLIQENQLETKFLEAGINNFDIELIIDFIRGEPSDSSKRYHKTFLYEIVSNSYNGVDVDKWDYFLRDALHLNLNITFDYKRLLNSCTIVENNGEYHIGYRDKTALDLYEMYNCRAALHHKAYQHRVVKNIELMLVDAFKEASENYFVYRSKDGTEVKLKDAHKYEDVFSCITDHIQFEIQYSRLDTLKNSRDILKNIAKRKLYTFIGRRRLKLEGEDRLEDKKALARERAQLLEKFPTSKCGQPGIAEVYIDVGKQLDPVSKVYFYQKAENSGVPQYRKWEEVKKNLSPFPFGLSEKRSAELLVFCKSTEVDEEHKKIHEKIKTGLGLE